MSPERERKLAEIQEMRSVPLCWDLVRIDYIQSGIRIHKKKKVIETFHYSAAARARYKRLLNAPNNGFLIENLKLVPRRLRFGEGLYV